MAFAYTVTEKTVFGNKRVAHGTYTSTSSGIGGDIVTGLGSVDHISLSPKGSAVTTNAPSVNETLPLSSGTITIVTDVDEVGTWFAIGL